MKRYLLVLACALIAAGGVPHLAWGDSERVAPGDLDPSFSADGKQITDFGLGDGGSAVAIQGDGKIVVAGGSGDAVGGSYDLALSRYTPDGTLDPSFSGDGKLTTDFGGGNDAAAVALQADGKIVVAGSSRIGTAQNDLALARYRADGSLDTAFSDEGTVTTDLGGYDDRAGVAIQADGRIVVAGSHIGAGETTSCSCGTGSMARWIPRSRTTASRRRTSVALISRMRSRCSPMAGSCVAGRSGGDKFALARYGGERLARHRASPAMAG